MDTGPAPKPFLPASGTTCMDRLGLVPTQKTFPPSLAPKPANINAKSIAAVRGLEEDIRLAALAEAERKVAEAVKAENVTAFGAQLRTAILAGDDVSFWRAARHADDVKQSVEVSKARAAAAAAAASPMVAAAAVARSGDGSGGGDAAADGTSKASMLSFVDDLLKEATLTLESPSGRTDGTKDASTSGGGSATVAAAAAAASSTPRTAAGGGRKGHGGGGGGGSANKPAWALTEEEVSKLEDAEEEELLKFADDLDFEAFMAALDDPELQECVKASSSEGGKAPAPGEEKAWRRNLVKAMNHVAMKRVAAARRAGRDGDDEDSGSVAVGSDGITTALSKATAVSRMKSEAAAAKRAALSEAKGEGAAGGGWDASTRASDDVGRMERAKAATVEAFEFLRENPELRAVHSPASVRAMITKADTVVGAVGKALLIFTTRVHLKDYIGMRACHGLCICLSCANNHNHLYKSSPPCRYALNLHPTSAKQKATRRQPTSYLMWTPRPFDPRPGKLGA
ncbi:hypothetical protein VOLCADRAFT_92897 [Volvox carteri f. nagariensis]|uniref:Uncharacterized protein n=1 Tax=Volvox carteri f. nagariensis TaxID=3068 RepID=D8U0R6_VOLCA|nr:uncharacterized protein VOLCADRAFT_92897 [Volvox carteri f. nagariensis]EFJ46762.1 hypothetical protein VOLCADRAFT_92897 [Volvox carteri f. nagariensis]|eukprot:XP_002952291.1 hypothetical protein VOLCADRAFT_92897 [Volvox carteri f. nagariensis]